MSITRDALQTVLTNITANLWEKRTGTGNGYTNVAWPTASVTATLTVDYYDNYANIPGLPVAYKVTSGVSKMTNGLPTAKKVAVLNTPANMLWNVMYYDDLGRNKKSYAQHYLGGVLDTLKFDVNSTTYDFTNAPTTITRQHFISAGATPSVTIVNQYIYDHMGRKLKTWEQITNGTTATTKTLLSKIEYNEIGQVLNKRLHSTDSISFYQKIAYTYNERGWLLGSSAPLFAMQLYYNTGANKQYNGNIAYQYWGTPGSLTNNYTYTYDKLNRLTGGISNDNYKEQNIAYDLMGNITALQRYQAGTLIDNLAYTYGSTNQLQSINDATASDLGLKHGTSAFTYDGNGNLKTDPTKAATGITIGYNLLNLPQAITGGKTITYTYDALGNKLRRSSTATNNTDYINGIQYDGSTTPALTFIQTEEGRARPNGASAYTYEYDLADHLGNTRLTFNTTQTTQKDDYYPFGMEISRGAIVGAKNEYLYNKKELQEELGEYDYGARFYDPVVGRFITVDPVAEHFPWMTSYQYASNDPIKNKIGRAHV